MKDIEGVYKVELLGLHGWESFSTAFIERCMVFVTMLSLSVVGWGAIALVLMHAVI